MKISDDIIYCGVNDKKIDLFEGQFPVPNGMSYNSYLIRDEKIAVLDSVDKDFGDEWLEKIEAAACGASVDFLVVHHMESDHSANILNFAKKYPNAKIVASQMAFRIMKNFFETDFAERRIVVKEGDSLDLGKHKLNFIAAPNVHWPEVIFSYEPNEKILFSADAFGKFGAIDEENPLDDWACEARRYYFGIVGKFGANVQAALKKVSALEINQICPLHGPVLRENLREYISLYETWSKYEAESEGVTVAYASIYGHTKAAVEKFAEKLRTAGCPKVAVSDVARDDVFEVIEDAFRYGKLVLAAPTYNCGVFPAMKNFIDALTERNFQNRKIGFIENGSWAPQAAKAMCAQFGNCKNLEFCENVVSIKGEMKSCDEEKMDALVKELLS